jgi:maltooligosyltrehalose trehalohydrolase
MDSTRPSTQSDRRYPIGAEVIGDAVSFRVWAPGRDRVAVVLEDGAAHSLRQVDGGYFAGVVAGLGPGCRYRFRLDDDERLYPDPASRSQPDGPHGPSRVVDFRAFPWRDRDWRGVSLKGQVLYEMHVGTFTTEGTWAAATTKLPGLRKLGVTSIEMMPINEFAGDFGWGYDGVNLFAPTRLYGAPDDLKRFIDAAHAVGIGVILDVVYNHFGSDGNFLDSFTADYFTDRYENEWGKAINFDGRNCAGVREFFTANAAYWIEEYHFDGLRLDATQALRDSSPEHIIASIAKAARGAAGARSIVLVAENEPQECRLARPLEAGGYGLDAIWNDDFHHAAMVAATGRCEAYYSDFTGSPQEFVSVAKYGFLFQGQRSAWQEQRRGSSALSLEPLSFVNFLQNHDQIANSARGARFHQMTSPGRARALTALALLGPQTPMLFQGQEFWASAPFLYFADAGGELRRAVRQGRKEFLGQFPSLTDPSMSQALARPSHRETFAACKLDWSEEDENAAIVALHRDLLRLRREDRTFAAQVGANGPHGRIDGAVLGTECFVLRFFGSADDGDRLLLVNLGRSLVAASLAEPLLAPPDDAQWTLTWTSENPAYDGDGTPPIEDEAGWRIPGHGAYVLAAISGAEAGSNSEAAP